MKKAAYLTAWILAFAITSTFAVAVGTTGTANGTGTKGMVTDTIKKHTTWHTKKAKRAARKADSIALNKGSATLSDGTDARGSGNNGTGGNGTGNGGNGGVGTGKPQGGGTGSGVKVKP
ncbi:hypothetical protein [Mucilaginibacter sp. UYCu711]|uniref:hypothetical protein n=1 Tax=Mucilaginibacter sp. UYCu711 TaxID=3156339 RepID=UPI003D21939B